MSQITKEELLALSKKYTDTANAMLDYLIANHLDNADVDKSADDMLNLATELTELSAIQTGKDVHDALIQLDSITNRVQSTIQKITDIQKIIDIATDLVAIAGAVIELDPEKIINSVDNLAGIVSSLKTDDMETPAGQPS